MTTSRNSSGPTHLTEAEKAALEPRKSDAELACEYAMMMEEVWMNRDELDLDSCPPDRRIFRGGREAWIYDHGKIAELVFVK